MAAILSILRVKSRTSRMFCFFHSDFQLLILLKH